MRLHVEISRRSILGMLATSSIGMLLMYPGRSISGSGQLDAKDNLAMILANRIHEKESARIIGREYLRCAVAERDVGLLVDKLFSGSADYRADFAAADDKGRNEMLRKQKCKDFEQGRVVKVRQWLLSETEARLCALSALL